METYQVTGELIKSAIALKIRQAFSVVSGTPAVTVYPIITKEKTTQGHEAPSFFIWQLDMSQDEVSTGTFERMYQMNVRYFPEETSTMYETMDAVGNKLLEVLSNIEVPIIIGTDVGGDYIFSNRLVRGTNLDCKISDDVLQSFANYTVRVKLQEAILPDMLYLDTETTIK